MARPQAWKQKGVKTLDQVIADQKKKDEAFIKKLKNAKTKFSSSSPAPSDEDEGPDMSWKKADLLKYARENLGLEVEEDLNKQRILTLIERAES